MDSNDKQSLKDNWVVEHVVPVRVYYEDTDAGGIVYYANYLKFGERARTELLRDIGVPHEEIKRKWKVEFVVRACSINYLAPAVLDDELCVRTSCETIGGASVTLRQVVTRGEEELVPMEVKIAARDCESGGATRLPKEVRSAFLNFSNQNE